ncbi:helix-turn-helix domain-containing protein [Lactiplantibacillus pentosus]|uniref:Helix-turn-helix domain-containing protein n=1 Tax=Lactiplantibacillus pentosus TaxID=1589 RepID=A0AB37RHS8_LACPE|nr:helix-turn-helix domain-containing protein [Lactiplantibacillus pentosus]RMW42372.1 helix-turn-helix domain-containing protein [Lactiplantibacillus pentosus]RMW48458.1 helix-turn-helix domain-containing protein [Lactiplantibacillus pentosus]RMW52595.1 helix-turn-helix domain-containing protein [Lactiplantibacillus pentosus]RMW55329.1 helix-turn-helix domain-containing protein [Lactiplantibacillus pentosus]
MDQVIENVLNYLLRVTHAPIRIYAAGKLIKDMGQPQDGPHATTTVDISGILQQATRQFPRLYQDVDQQSLATIANQRYIYVLGPIAVAAKETGHVDCDWSLWLEGLCLLQNVVNHTKLHPSDIYLKNHIGQLSQAKNDLSTVARFNHNQEAKFIHNPYDQEIRELKSVETGDLAALKASMRESFAGEYAQLGPTELRSTKNLIIVDLALLARAAIRGGVDYEQSFTINDQFINSVEVAQSTKTVIALGLEAKTTYTKLVHQRQVLADTTTNRIIRRGQVYVQTHLHERITLDAVSQYCTVSPQYFSHLFRTTQHQCFSHYVQQEKINASKRELNYTQHAISAIAFDFGYTSASHFAAVFKKYVGLTPHEFRANFGKV